MSRWLRTSGPPNIASGRRREGDASFTETAQRVAKAVAAAEAPELSRLLGAAVPRRDPETSASFRPAGCSPAPAPSARSRLFNCFVMGTIPDSLNGIFEHLKEAALTMQQGGGVGMDFSTIRPSGSPVHGVGARCVRTADLHGLLGFHVPHGAFRRPAARRDDGVPADRSPGHRGLH